MSRLSIQFLLLILVGGVCAAHDLRDELRQASAKTNLIVADFGHGKLWIAPLYHQDDWKAEAIRGAVGHSWSDEALPSPDGTLAAFQYWPVDPCPTWQTCDSKAFSRFYLAIVNM